MRSRYLFRDGRTIEADGPVELFEKLRRTEPLAPADLGRYLDLLRSRSVIGLGRDVDVGTGKLSLETRCHLALGSLSAAGWLHERRAAER